MNVTEREWMAYVDGELDAPGAARVEAAAREDPRLAALIEGQRALRGRLRAAFEPVIEEPVPDRLRRVLRRQPGRPRRDGWLSLAASLALGVLVASAWHASTEGPFRLANGDMLARGGLRDALDRRLSVDPPDHGVAIGMSFRGSGGTHCRAFALPAHDLAGLACLESGGWRVVALGTTPIAPPGSPGGLRTAGSALPPAVLAEVDARIQGEPLDADGERRARDTGWR